MIRYTVTGSYQPRYVTYTLAKAAKWNQFEKCDFW